MQIICVSALLQCLLHDNVRNAYQDVNVKTTGKNKNYTGHKYYESPDENLLLFRTGTLNENGHNAVTFIAQVNGDGPMDVLNV